MGCVWKFLNISCRKMFLSNREAFLIMVRWTMTLWCWKAAWLAQTNECLLSERYDTTVHTNCHEIDFTMIKVMTFFHKYKMYSLCAVFIESLWIRFESVQLVCFCYTLKTFKFQTKRFHMRWLINFAGLFSCYLMPFSALKCFSPIDSILWGYLHTKTFRASNWLNY